MGSNPTCGTHSCESSGPIPAGSPVVTFERTGVASRGGVSVTGLSEPDSFDPGAHVPDQPGFHVVVGHAPDFALGRVEADLLVAGHTHGGQVQLPIVGP